MSSNRYGQLKCSTLEGAWGGRAESISPTPFTTLEYENIDILKYIVCTFMDNKNIDLIQTICS